MGHRLCPIDIHVVTMYYMDLSTACRELGVVGLSHKVIYKINVKFQVISIFAAFKKVGVKLRFQLY